MPVEDRLAVPFTRARRDGFGTEPIADQGQVAAARLWREALADSRRQHAPNSPEYWNAALTQWRKALDEQRVERSMSWIVPLMRTQRRLFELSLRSIELWLHWAASRTRTPG